jgi:hypothetical protein
MPRMPYVTHFILSDFVSPVCLAPEGAGITRNLDERAGYGTDCAFVIYTGRKLARFSTELLMWTTEQRDYFADVFQPLLRQVPRRGPVSQSSGGYQPGKAHLIWSPQLFPLGITQCIVECEHQETIDEYMVHHVVVDFCQVVPVPKAAYAKPEAAEAEQPPTALEMQLKDATQRLADARQANEAAGQ